MRLHFAVVVAAGLMLASAQAFAQQATVTTQGAMSGVSGTIAAPTPVPAEKPSLAQAAMAVTPAEAQQYQKQVNAMTPAQRQELVRQAYKNWNTMSTADKTKLHDMAVSGFQKLPAEEQHQQEMQALAKWRSMSPQEQQELKDAFPDLLQGDLVLTGNEFPTN
ncbi:MAG: DUF3106 domain-containing protein [Micavibrio sp.]|nr:DUF3106 domain-containing protein [Micavibrio sp.]